MAITMGKRRYVGTVSSTNATPDWQMVALYTVNIVGGSATPNPVKVGDTVQVMRNEAEIPAGEHFVNWTAEGITLTQEQKTAETFEFTMPDGEVTITAHYEKIASRLSWKSQIPAHVPQAPCRLERPRWQETSPLR